MNGEKIVISKKKYVRMLFPKIIDNFEKKHNRQYSPEDLKRLKHKVYYMVSNDFKHSYGFCHPYTDVIVLGQAIGRPQDREIYNSVTTISHESIHLLVVEVLGMETGPKASRQLDTGWSKEGISANGSILKRLERDGYLGGHSEDQQL